jgi:hypothetical protein
VTDPPLVNSSPNPATRRLLEAGLSDEPAPQVRPIVAAALGVSVSATASSSSGLARIEVGSQMPPVSRAVPTQSAEGQKPSSTRPLDGAAKWFAAGALLGIVASAVLLVAKKSPERSEAAPSVSAAPAASAGPTVTVAPASAAPVPSAAPAPSRAFDIDTARERAVRQALGVAAPEVSAEGSARPGPLPAEP